MKTSKYAPTTPAERLAQSRSEKIKRDKERANRLLTRLRWKAELLHVSYCRTLEIITQAEHHHSVESGATNLQAESMFKIDFFEFYTLLERYITDCLASLGFHVSAAAPAHNVNLLRYIINPDLHNSRPLATHAFHANLLEALDDVNCPLHVSLGAQDVRVQLGIAKDFRNAWKDAETKSGFNRDSGIKLQDLQLELMLRAIITGCEQANVTVQAHEGNTTDGPTLSSRDFEPQNSGSSNADMADMPFEYMEDAMELD